MTNKLITSSNSDVFDSVSDIFHSLVGNLENFLFAADKIHILSLTLATLALVTLLFIFIFVCTKIFSFFFGKKTVVKKSSEIAQANNESYSDLENELESELNQNSNIEISEDPQSTPTYFENLVEDQEDNYQKDYKDLSKGDKKDSLIDLDWKKTKNTPTKRLQGNTFLAENSTIKKNLNELICMIVNMLGRHVDELKIAQALMYRCKDNLSEESVLQIVVSVKNFLTLCQQGAFDNIRRVKDLPSDEESVLRLIAGDPSYAMALIESLMDEKINQAIAMKNSAQRTALFKQSSKLACYFGTLAELNDKNLASASFELAVEMHPENALAWSRCADLYYQLGMEEKACWAYRNVLNLAKKDRDISQEANARRFLSQYLYAQGESVQASELYLESKNYYDSIGINRPLDRKELEIIDLMDKTSTESIINSVLPRSQNFL